jgi:predicted CXXCH cytochrome family protein
VKPRHAEAAGSPPARGRKLRWALGALAGIAVVVPLFFVGLAAKERDNNFCISCHLHEEKFKRFTSAPFRDLTAPHHAKNVRCIDCHGGADFPMRLQVWAVAGFDSLRYVVGRYREPEHMRLPLRSKECSRCHTPILKNAPKLTAEEEGASEGQAGNSYHAIRGHDTVRIRCMRCHTSHTADSEAQWQFLARGRVQPICRECHPRLGEG